MIELKQVNRQYAGPAGVFTGLREVSVEVPAGQLTAVVGRSGSGKSTLLNLLGGIDSASSGTVRVGGVSLAEQSEAELTHWRCRHVGFVFQFFQLIPTLTALENVVLPMDFLASARAGARRSRALELLARFGVAEHAGKLPSTLSGGEQQRVAIARALANDPAVLLADEPTGNLDSQSAGVVIELLRSLAQDGKTVVVATHDEAIRRQADRTLELSDGYVVRDSAAAAAP